jgi:DNA transformation protein
MPVTPEFRAFVLEQLERVASPVRMKSMFGGIGVYSGDLFFALIDDDELYLKVDDTNRPDFESRGLGPFQPFGPDGESMQYYPLPGDLLEDAEALGEWVAKALDVARRKKKRSRK